MSDTRNDWFFNLFRRDTDTPRVCRVCWGSGWVRDGYELYPPAIECDACNGTGVRL